jgi:hypothetical protein
LSTQHQSHEVGAWGIHGAYQELQSRGNTFGGAPHLIHRQDPGVEEWTAFFRDPGGQPLAIMAQTRG